jgi:hypothetical protein
MAMDRRFAARLVEPGLAVSYVGARRDGCLGAFFACPYFAICALRNARAPRR